MEEQQLRRLSINEWNVEDRPREKMMRLGAGALTNAELLAILIGSGSPKESAVELMRRVMKCYNDNLNTLGKQSVRELCSFGGIGPAKAVTILAACELGKRRSAMGLEDRFQIQSSSDLYNYFLPRMQDLAVEEMHVLLMNQAMRVLGEKMISRGGITATVVDVRLIMEEALLTKATTIALCHNHPSGNVQPSQDDDRVTQQVREACKVMNIRMLDHIVLTDGDFYSYMEHGRL